MATRVPPAHPPPGDPPDSAMQPLSQPEDSQSAPRARHLVLVTRHQSFLSAWASHGVDDSRAQTFHVAFMMIRWSEGVEAARTALDNLTRQAFGDPAMREAVKAAYSPLLIGIAESLEYSSDPGSSPKRKRRCQRGKRGRPIWSGGGFDAS